jgi:hypothetical protein
LETPLERHERSPPGGGHAPYSFPAIILMRLRIPSLHGCILPAGIRTPDTVDRPISGLGARTASGPATAPQEVGGGGCGDVGRRGLPKQHELRPFDLPFHPANPFTTATETLIGGRNTAGIQTVIVSKVGEKVTCWFVAPLVSRGSYSSSIPMATTKRDTIL